jgi:hypothetical protein
MTLFVHAVIMTAVSVIGGVGSWSVAPLFAEGDPGGVVVLGVVFSAIGYAAKWLVEQWAKKRKDTADEEERRHGREAKTRDDEIEHWKKLVIRYDAEHKRLVRVERRMARAEAWIQAQQMIMRHQKIDFIPYDPTADDDDSDDATPVIPHGPLPIPVVPGTTPPVGGIK